MNINTNTQKPTIHNNPQQPSGQYRTIDGSHNNVEHPEWGKQGETYVRSVPNDYQDGTHAPSGSDRPNPRAVSNAVSDQVKDAGDERGLSGMSWAWGQFLDHDMVLTPNAGRPDFSVQVPAGDKHFDPQGGGKAIIPLARSLTKKDSQGVEQQFNKSTSWIDGSMIYGSNKERANALRSFKGGKLNESEPGYLPWNTQGLDNEDPYRGKAGRLYLAGDRRANENVGLTSLHTLFLREHNRLAEQFAKDFPQASDEELYQKARKVVGAQVQAITFNEFLPSLLGEKSLPEYQGYKPDVDPRISNVFNTAAYRMGHSQVSGVVQRIEENGDEIEQGHLCLEGAFHRPHQIKKGGGIEPILRGLAEYLQEATDPQIHSTLRNRLFGPPGRGGLDLASINIQRGRDHGLDDYNTYRANAGLPKAQSFADITSNTRVQEALAKVYDSPDQIDPWVGFLCEDKAPGSSVGHSLQSILSDQFTRLRDGDRFFYKNDPEVRELAPDIENLTLAKLIKRNTNVVNIQDDVFFSRDPEAERDPVCRIN